MLRTLRSLFAGRQPTSRKPTCYAPRRYVPGVEILEDRTAPATFNIAAGDTAGLIAAITQADALPGASTINLTAGSPYTFTTPDNYWYGPDALPAISNNITIN